MLEVQRVNLGFSLGPVDHSQLCWWAWMEGKVLWMLLVQSLFVEVADFLVLISVCDCGGWRRVADVWAVFCCSVADTQFLVSARKAACGLWSTGMLPWFRDSWLLAASGMHSQGSLWLCPVLLLFLRTHEEPGFSTWWTLAQPRNFLCLYIFECVRDKLKLFTVTFLCLLLFVVVFKN